MRHVASVPELGLPADGQNGRQGRVIERAVRQAHSLEVAESRIRLAVEDVGCDEGVPSDGVSRDRFFENFGGFGEFAALGVHGDEGVV